MKIALAFLLLQAAPDAARYENPAKEIQWARSVDDALREAKLRNVPILIYLTSDS